MWYRLILICCVAVLLAGSGCGPKEVELLSEEEVQNIPQEELAAREQLQRAVMQRDEEQAKDLQQYQQEGEQQ